MIRTIYHQTLLLLALTGSSFYIFAETTEEANNQQPLTRIEIAERLLRPWDMDFLSADTALVTEKEGTLQKVNLLTGEKTPIKGLPEDLSRRNQTGIGDNSGLFAVKLDPDFSENQWVYLSYAATSDKGNGATTKVIRGKFYNDTLTDLQTLLVATPYTEDRYHYGGGLIFGADGKLYITVGERLFNEKDEPALPIAQNYRDKRGKIYRLNPDGSIPTDNPAFPGESVPGLYALGIRAAQGLTLHPHTQHIWFSEHGTRQGDEINLLKAGANYGWPIKTTGGYRFQEYQPPALADRTFTPPVWYWEHTVAPTGLTFYQGSEFPQWNGNLLLAGLSRGSFWRMTLKGHEIVEAEELFTEQRIRLRNVKQGPDGKLYLLTDEANGRVLRVVAR